MSMSAVAAAAPNPISKAKQVIETINGGALTTRDSIPGDIRDLISWPTVPPATKTDITKHVKNLLANHVDDVPVATLASDESYRFLADTKLIVNAYGEEPAGEKSILEIMNTIARASGSDKVIESKPSSGDEVSIPLDVLNIASEAIFVAPSAAGGGRSIADLIREEVANKVSGTSEVATLTAPTGLTEEQSEILAGVQGGGIAVEGADAKSAALCLRIDNQLQ